MSSPPSPGAGTPAAAPLPARTRAATGAGGAIAALSRRLGRGSGSVIGGRAILAVDPRALERLSAGHRIGLVSGTNGKTTTTSLLSAGLATLGPVATNLTGANLPPGITSALAAASPGSAAALEVDEAWLGRVVATTGPAVAVLLNLSRDQLDRNNEVRRLAGSWRATFAGAGDTTVVANADDPLVVWGAGAAASVVWVGAGQPWTADAAGCPRCGSRIVFEAGPDGRVGTHGWACSGCDLRRPEPEVTVAAGEASGRGWRVPLRLSLPGRCNQANASLALAAAVRMGADPAAAVEAMRSTAEVVGRYGTVNAAGVEARLLLSKNPAGWLEIFDILRPPPAPVVVAINSRIADGRDPSWLWDVPFETLAGRRVVATGERSADLAVRLHYAGVDHVRVPDLLAAVREAGRIAAAPPGQAPAIDVVANYTSFQQLRARLAAGQG